MLTNFDRHFEVVTDACEVPPAIGGVLLQNDHPIAFYSRKLSGVELNYSATDKEMLGVIAALREWRCFLEGKPFTLITDHKPNTYLDTASNVHTMRRRARWLEESSGFDYTWRYRAGRINVADPISRAPQHFNSVLPMQLASIRGMVLVRQAPTAIPGPLSGCSPDSLMIINIVRRLHQPMQHISFCGRSSCAKHRDCPWPCCTRGRPGARSHQNLSETEGHFFEEGG
jgi:hypothetical protein